MKTLFLVFAHILVTIAKLLRPGGAKALVADNLLLKQQLLIISRSRLLASNLTPVHGGSIIRRPHLKTLRI